MDYSKNTVDKVQRARSYQWKGEDDISEGAIDRINEFEKKQQSTAKIRGKRNLSLRNIRKKTNLQLKFKENRVCLWKQYIANWRLTVELALP